MLDPSQTLALNCKYVCIYNTYDTNVHIAL